MTGKATVKMKVPPVVEQPREFGLGEGQCVGHVSSSPLR